MKKQEKNNIEFISSNLNVTNSFPPVPAKNCIPEWYKNLPLNNQYSFGTIKGCIPVQDMITSGYIIRNGYEIDISLTSSDEDVDIIGYKNENAKLDPKQLGKHQHHQCPITFDNEKKQYFKLLHYWTIKTPPGYSCLLMQPYWHRETRYTIFPAIVDTDTYDCEIIFTGVIHSKETVTIKPGDPLVQVIPFKRENWSHTIKDDYWRDSAMSMFIDRKVGAVCRRLYKNIFHKKKTFD